MNAKRIRVLIVDDSALVRRLLTDMLSSDPGIEVVGAAGDAYVAREKIKELNPDVLTLDVEMPKMDGVTFLRNLMRLRPMPVVMVSSLTEDGASITLDALATGAVDFLTKPKIDVAATLGLYRDELIAKIKTAATARLRPYRELQVTERLGVDAVLPKAAARPFRTTDRIIAIGASTGGTEAIRDVLMGCEPDTPGIVIAQHIPKAFSAAFARRLNDCCPMVVFEAEDGQQVLPGHVYIAPGDRHLLLSRDGARYVCRLDDGPPRQPPQAIGRRAVPFRGAVRRQQRHRRDPDRHGQRRCDRAQGNARGRCADDRPGRGEQRRLGHAGRGGRRRCRRPGAAPRFDQPGAAASNHGIGAAAALEPTFRAEDSFMTIQILAVDDSASMRQMVGFTLRHAGYSVIEAADGVDALNYARTNAVDLVLTDVNMPNMDGITLVRELRRLESYKFVPMLVLTTEAGQDKKMKGKEAGATGWLVKPFNPEKLLATIAKVL